MKFQFSLASQADDPELRQLIAECPMPGKIGVAFEREPEFFKGCSVSGHKHKVYIARNREGGDMAMLAVTAELPRFLGRYVKTIGYLGQLRVAEKYLGNFLPLRAMKFFHEQEEKNGPELFFSVVSRENITPRQIFNEHPRPGFPQSIPFGNIYTAGIRVGRKKKIKKIPFKIQKGSPVLLDDIITFLNREGARKPLHPHYSRSDFTENELTRGFKLDDMRIAYRGKEILGTVGYWDQSTYKQSVVSSYPCSLRLIRPFYNIAAKIFNPVTGLPPLPRIGESIKSAYGAFICIKNNDQTVFQALLNHVYNRAAEQGKHHLLVGLAENDSLIECVKKYRHIAYESSIFLFSLRGTPSDYFNAAHLKGREAPYIEIAAL